jgi:tetratricopeptide (TPR) repeat protein
MPLVEGRQALTVQGERYGTLADTHPLTLRVRGIFEKIVRAAGRRPGVAPEVHVLETPKVIAQALPGGLVVVSKGFVNLARSDENAIAFVLGHEVAHLLRDHHRVLGSLGLGAGSDPVRAPAAEQARAHQAMELEADRLGVLFSALAGYQAWASIPVVTALAQRTGPDLFHPHPQERASAIRKQITEVSEHLEVFHLGLFLLGVGRYLEAARVLEHFLALFPSREVLSTVGVAYHKEALRYAPEPEFRHLLVIDPTTRAPAPRSAAPHPAFRQFLQRAVQYYTLALDADPTYAPAPNNLAAAYLDLGERDLALGHANRALREDPRLASGYNNRALAHLMAKEYRLAEEDLLRAASLDPGRGEVAHNLARLYEIQGRADEASRWRTRPESEKRQITPERVGSLSPGMPINSLREWMAEPGARQIRLPLGGSGSDDLALLVFSRRGLAVLARNNLVEAVGTREPAGVSTGQGLQPGDPAPRVEAAYGRPAGLDGVQALNVLGYPARALAVFIVNDRVQAIWVGRPPRSER